MGTVRVCKKIVAMRTGERDPRKGPPTSGRKSQVTGRRRSQVAGPWALLLLLWLHSLGRLQEVHVVAGGFVCTRSSLFLSLACGKKKRSAGNRDTVRAWRQVHVDGK